MDYIDSKESFEENLIRSESISEVKKVVSKLPEDKIELVHMIYKEAKRDGAKLSH
jgi:hypothetical protein